MKKNKKCPRGITRSPNQPGLTCDSSSLLQVLGVLRWDAEEAALKKKYIWLIGRRNEPRDRAGRRSSYSGGTRWTVDGCPLRGMDSLANQCRCFLNYFPGRLCSAFRMTASTSLQDSETLKLEATGLKSFIPAQGGRGGGLLCCPRWDNVDGITVQEVFLKSSRRCCRRFKHSACSSACAHLTFSRPL